MLQQSIPSMRMIKKLLILLVLVLFSVNVHAAETTTNYELVIPAIGDRNWQPIISRDIVSIDKVLGFVSTDSAWVEDGSYTYLRRGSSRVGIGTSSPTVSLDVLGVTSSDGFCSNGGSISTAAYYFDGDVDTGIYRQAANIGGMTAGGTSIITWDSVGVCIQPSASLGIGTKTPITSLDVLGQMSTDAIRFSAEAVASADVTTGAPCLVVSKDPAGNVYLNFYNGTVWQKVSLE